MAYPLPAVDNPLGRTSRADTWWLVPSLMAAAFIVFIFYAVWASLQDLNFSYITVNEQHAVVQPTPAGATGHVVYRSPFYSPDLKEYFPWFPWSPAFLIVWLPSLFRLTCYYGRKAYHRSLVMNPPACAVGKGERSTKYKGESALPWVLNNLHRYFLYLILFLVAFHWIHLIEAYNFSGKFGMAMGSLVVSADTILLSLYVFSCHSLRHIVGGNVDCFSCARAGEARHKVWTGVSKLNQYHNMFFWLSLFTVGFADLYIRMVAMGRWTDVRFF
jgi:hypothetical protein